MVAYFPDPKRLPPQEDVAFLEGMTQTVVQTLHYGGSDELPLPISDVALFVDVPEKPRKSIDQMTYADYQACCKAFFAKQGKPDA